MSTQILTKKINLENNLREYISNAISVDHDETFLNPKIFA